MYEDWIIHSAETVKQPEAPDLVAVMFTNAHYPEPARYALYKDDPYGAAPTLRQKLQVMVDEQGFVIEGGNPEGWPWWVAPPPVEPDTGP